MKYYYRSRDFQSWSYSGTAVIQPGEGIDVDGSTPPCDAYVLIYAFFCVGILFGMGLLLYSSATLYSERILAKALQSEGIITQKGHCVLCLEPLIVIVIYYQTLISQITFHAQNTIIKHHITTHHILLMPQRLCSPLAVVLCVCCFHRSCGIFRKSPSHEQRTR